MIQKNPLTREVLLLVLQFRFLGLELMVVARTLAGKSDGC
jgi:hypothetical protein